MDSKNMLIAIKGYTRVAKKIKELSDE
jgi:hypothetical protein